MKKLFTLVLIFGILSTIHAYKQGDVTILDNMCDYAGTIDVESIVERGHAVVSDCMSRVDFNGIFENLSEIRDKF